jgi:microcystin-dependent protein
MSATLEDLDVKVVIDRRINSYRSWAWFQITSFSVANFISVVILIIISSQLGQRVSDVSAQLALVSIQIENMKSIQAQVQRLRDEVIDISAVLRSNADTVSNLTELNVNISGVTRGFASDVNDVYGRLSYINATWYQSVGNIVASVAPMGYSYQLCDGSWLSATSYPGLRTILQGLTTSNSTHFRVPDMMNKVMMGDYATSFGVMQTQIASENMPAHMHRVSPYSWDYLTIGNPGVQSLNFNWGGGCLQGTSCGGSSQPLKASFTGTQYPTEIVGSGTLFNVTDVLKVACYIKLG